MSGELELVDPLGQVGYSAGLIQPRPGALEGRVVGLLDSSKPNADLFLDRVEELLRERCGPKEVLRYRKVKTEPAPFIEELAARAEVVINAFGD